MLKEIEKCGSPSGDGTTIRKVAICDSGLYDPVREQVKLMAGEQCLAPTHECCCARPLQGATGATGCEGTIGFACWVSSLVGVQSGPVLRRCQESLM